jgi:hypothetical protein
MKRFLLIAGLGLLLGAAEAPWTYTNDLETASLGPPPKDIMAAVKVEVKSDGKNKFIEAGPFPTDSLSILFGPDQSVAAGARIKGESSGQRTPELGVGVGGPGGWKIWLMPATHQAQLICAEEIKASIPFDWKSGAWTQFRIQISPAGQGKWKVQGKAWEDGKPEPDWMIEAQTSEEPLKGKAAAIGMPYSDKPIDFDDLKAR